MSLNLSKGNMYDWVTHTWNTVKGKCNHDCQYCYMKTWGDLRATRFDEKEFRTDLGNGNTIFVGNSNDMFADNIPSEWIERTIEYCRKFDNTYVFQTKDPGRLLRMSIQLPKMMIGTTIETNQQDLLNKISKAPPVVARSAAMSELHSRGWRTFITIEPIMMFDLDPFAELILQASPDFVNIGADSKQHGLVEPKKTEVDLLIQYLVSKGISIRKKENLGRLS